MRISTVALGLVTFSLVAQQTPSSPDVNAIFTRTKAATVVVLAGDNAGRVRSIATGVIVSPDGVLLTAFHPVKGAASVQIRMVNGEIYDRVTLLGSDERRDVAALRIPARNLPALKTASFEGLIKGDPISVLSSADGLTWQATTGVFSGVQAADEIPGAGSGFRVLQFSAPVARGSSGGALLDRWGALVGIIANSLESDSVAIPTDSFVALADSGRSVQLGSGTNLVLPTSNQPNLPATSAAIATEDPKKLLARAKTIHIRSKTSFLTVDTVERGLLMHKDWTSLGLTLVHDFSLADLEIAIDRPLFTFVYTFVVSDKKTSITLASGKVTAADGTIASTRIAKDIVEILSAQRKVALPK